MSKTPDWLNLSENPTGPPNHVWASATLQSPINSDNDCDSLDSYLPIDIPPSPVVSALESANNKVKDIANEDLSLDGPSQEGVDDTIQALFPLSQWPWADMTIGNVFGPVSLNS